MAKSGVGLLFGLALLAFGVLTIFPVNFISTFFDENIRWVGIAIGIIGLYLIVQRRR